MKKVGTVFAVISSYIFGIIILLFAIICFVSNIYKQNFYSNVLKNIDFSKIKLSDLGIDIEGSLEDYFVYALSEIGIDKTSALSIIKSNEVKEVLGEFASDCVTYVSNRKEIPKIEKEDIKKVLNNKDVKEAVKDKINEEDVENIVNKVNDVIKEKVSDINIGDINTSNKGKVDKNAANAILVK